MHYLTWLELLVTPQPLWVIKREQWLGLFSKYILSIYKKLLVRMLWIILTLCDYDERDKIFCSPKDLLLKQNKLASVGRTTTSKPSWTHYLTSLLESVQPNVATLQEWKCWFPNLGIGLRMNIKFLFMPIRGWLFSIMNNDKLGEMMWRESLLDIETVL